MQVKQGVTHHWHASVQHCFSVSHRAGLSLRDTNIQQPQNMQVKQGVTHHWHASVQHCFSFSHGAGLSRWETQI